ncbi:MULTISPECIES: peptide MFS transporter [Sphingomonas]|uniref:MFS transporter n=1 Tax=Sphingomonas hankookensis TaxID=563996 RepID=A0ABR5YAA2_9SPHN|nr:MULTISPECIES: peptide MFS transporter [Sphingomonas]KZE11434.1 MFS transporter [Sphingomonas hankookensis]PZT92521.1 MAG: peptide MFS transporter [Sphingomonas sp.]RSV19599.1 peptide MFS transporter [Sphingomonas sp. ABOLH]WCP72123.1 peptide MFS transporter [Sphingomonas hankookensis]
MFGLPIIPSIAAGFLILLLLLGGVAAASKGEEFAGHPKGLYVLFFAEMWERFSYYGMRALLIFYLTKHWLFGDGESNLIYGAYTSLVYITPVLGGYLADRYLGQRKAVLFGAVILTIGHLLMAFEGQTGITDPIVKQADPAINVFWAALACIIVGSGFLKANISVIVGQLYSRTDLRRDGAYTIFYVGINVGAALGVIFAGFLGETYGWAYGFGAAGIGMLLGLIVFVLGKPLLKGQGEAPRPLSKGTEWGLYGLGVASIGVIWALIQYQSVIETLLIISGVALLGYVLFESFKLPKEPRERMFAILFLIALNPVFWGLFEQAGGSLNLYTDRYVDRGGVPASLFQSINAIYIVLLGPIFAALWVALAKRNLEPSAPAKFALALLQVGFSFLLFVWGARTVGPEIATPVLFVFLIYFFQTTGELCLSPVGLSAMNRLAPKHLASLIMGAWFYMTAVGNFVAGKIGEATGGHDGEMTKEGTLSVYNSIGWWTIGIGVVVLLLSPIVKRWMHLDTLADDADHSLAGQAEIGEPKAAGVDVWKEEK